MSHRYDWTGPDFDETAAKPGTGWAILGLAITLLLGMLIVASPDAARCERITNEQSRLACFDAAASPRPAKGAAISRN